jgi:SpoVK/Ycf46/Vps4 family AAA+-type ATPase
LFGDRDGSGVIVGQLASTLLQCMDDISRWSEANPSNDENEPTKNGRIVVLGATNTPWMIDKAFLRPGRFDRTVHVGLPDLDEREEILKVHICKMKLAPSEDAEGLCKSIAELCLGFSGADLAALCRAAAVRCLSEGGDEEGIRAKHYKDAFMHDIVPSSNEELVQRILNWKC